MKFIKWSDVNLSSKTVLNPNLDIKGWDELNTDKKELIWQHLRNKNWFDSDEITHKAVFDFAEDHKAGNYCHHLHSHGGPHYYDSRNGMTIGFRMDCCNAPAQMDVNRIFIREKQDVVYELISYYAEVLKNVVYNNQYSKFVNCFNDLSDQFGLNIILTDNGLVLRQDPKISDEIYEPVLNYLADKKWESVNRDLKDAFADYLKNTPEGYSSCITHAISGLQAFLQIIVNGDTGKGQISDLLKIALTKNLIPDDSFSEKIFKDIVSILMTERQTKGDSHPKNEYASEKIARLVLNLIMIFMQHTIQN